MIHTYSKKQERSEINNFTLHLKELEKEQTKPKVDIKKEIPKINAEINEIETRKMIEKVNETKSCFLKINKTDKSLARLRKKRDGSIQIVSEMKEEILQTVPRKYKGSYETTMNNYMPTNWTTRRNGQVSRNIQPDKTESRRNK